MRSEARNGARGTYPAGAARYSRAPLVRTAPRFPEKRLSILATAADRSRSKRSTIRFSLSAGASFALPQIPGATSSLAGDQARCSPAPTTRRNRKVSSPIELQDVFKTNGVPTHTFVEPDEYNELLLALKSPGRGVVIEGPSGIGKTTAVEKAIASLGLGQGTGIAITVLSARKQKDVEYIAALPSMGPVGVVVVDDFHKLQAPMRQQIADYMKTLADAEDEGTKLIVVGINKAGENLISFAHDLVNRIDVIRFESNPDHKVAELISKGESALNISLNVKDEIVAAANGGFLLAQLFGREVCIASNILASTAGLISTTVSFEAIKAAVWERLSASFRARTERFCRGTKMKREGRAPYLHLLHWLGQSSDWTLSIRDALRHHTELRGSVTQVVEKHYLEELIREDNEISTVLHYDPESQQLTIEDPQYLFYVRNLPWRTFAKDLGFISVTFDSRYDFALSFAGEDRTIAEALFNILSERDLEVFYDRNEQHRILATNIEDYLTPIYQSEARFVICLLSENYPKKIWTKIESDAFRERLPRGEVIPIFFSSAPVGNFDETKTVGGYEFKRNLNSAQQINEIATLCTRKLDLGGHPKPANDGHLKTGQRKRSSRRCEGALGLAHRRSGQRLERRQEAPGDRAGPAGLAAAPH
ncbi:MAG: TIR domain-containing protein [Deltaproteobacteria bacterium]|nr:TIR domain-containing protein [Deltaproteobacteria bacterium]